MNQTPGNILYQPTSHEWDLNDSNILNVILYFLAVIASQKYSVPAIPKHQTTKTYKGRGL
jgi:hypothetical protein